MQVKPVQLSNDKSLVTLPSKAENTFTSLLTRPDKEYKSAILSWFNIYLKKAFLKLKMEYIFTIFVFK